MNRGIFWQNFRFDNMPSGFPFVLVTWINKSGVFVVISVPLYQADAIYEDRNNT